MTLQEAREQAETEMKIALGDIVGNVILCVLFIAIGFIRNEFDLLLLFAVVLLLASQIMDVFRFQHWHKVRKNID